LQCAYPVGNLAGRRQAKKNLTRNDSFFWQSLTVLSEGVNYQEPLMM
jgi:hypothetical protein